MRWATSPLSMPRRSPSRGASRRPTTSWNLSQPSLLLLSPSQALTRCAWGRSTDAVVWTTLADVDDAVAAKCAGINELFTGDLGKVAGAEGEGELLAAQE